MTDDHSSGAMSPERRRLLYRAQHRGFKEADLVVGQFAEAKLPTMTPDEIEEFASLLEVPDQELFAWIIGRAPTPPNYEGPVMQSLRAFDIAALVAPKR